MNRREFIETLPLAAASLASPAPGNRTERLEWFRDLGFGMFIHWGVDVTIGSVISHSLVGASPDYVRRYYAELPRSFAPSRFDPRKWARLARLAGMRYVVFTAKHHSGFCMWKTSSTPLNVMNTPLGRDVTAEVLAAFRAEGIAPGIYISPDDFHFFHTRGYPIARPPAPRSTTRELPDLLRYGQLQLKELLGAYGDIDVLFIDGPADGLTDYAWQIAPNLVITRGAIQTPEQTVPETVLDQPWEACITMGTGWQHKPTNEVYKSGTELIRMLIEVRARGGNLLLNMGPTAEGEVPAEQEARLRELALWNFVNGEAIDGVRPWVISNEGDIWFTRRKNEPTLYAFLAGPPLEWGEWTTLTLRSVRPAADTRVSVLGQSGEILEYRPDVVPRTTWTHDGGGLHIRTMRAQRLYNNRRWPNPVVLKITNAAPAFQPPRVTTGAAKWDAASNCYRLQGELTVSDSGSLEVGFEWRKRRGATGLYDPPDAWKRLPLERRSAEGAFEACLIGVARSADAEFRAVVQHPLVTLYGAPQPVDPSKVNEPQ
jgi:alpha-L-fucosidase